MADLGPALVVANNLIMADPITASLISTSTEMIIEQEVGGTAGFQAHTEYGQPDSKREATTGWMIPLDAWDRGLGWTWDYLRKARANQIDNNVSSVIRDLKNLWAQKVLARLFKSTYTAVGSSGRSMPIADGGTADSAFVPVPVPDRASAFAYTHTHLGNGAGITQAILTAGVKHIWEHGYDAPYDLLIAQADIASWVNTTNVTGYVARKDPLISYGLTADAANVDTSYIGVVETVYGSVRVRASARIPTKYWAVYKSYGPMDGRNPLVVRTGEYGTQAVLLKGEGIRQFPLEKAIIFTEFGIGVANRLSAFVAFNDAGAYTDPTIL